MNLTTPGERTTKFLVTVALATIAGASITEAMAGGCITRECALFSIGWGAFWGAAWGTIHSIATSAPARNESLADTQPVKPHPIDKRKDVIAMPRHAYTVSVQDGNTLKLADLAYCYELYHRNDPSKHINAMIAAENFMDHIKRGGQISNRKCEAMCGGRDTYVAMRDKCVRLGLIVKVANGYAPTPPNLSPLDARDKRTHARE